MAKLLTPLNEFTTTLSAPEDNDDLVAASVEGILQALANRTEYNKQTLTSSLAGLATEAWVGLNYVAKAGDTMLGALLASGAPNIGNATTGRWGTGYFGALDLGFGGDINARDDAGATVGLVEVGAAGSVVYYGASARLDTDGTTEVWLRGPGDVILTAVTDLKIRSGNTTRWVSQTAGHFIPNAPNAYDIGASAAPVRVTHTTQVRAESSLALNIGATTKASLTSTALLGSSTTDLGNDSTGRWATAYVQVLRASTSVGTSSAPTPVVYTPVVRGETSIERKIGATTLATLSASAETWDFGAPVIIGDGYIAVDVQNNGVLPTSGAIRLGASGDVRTINYAGVELYLIRTDVGSDGKTVFGPNVAMSESGENHTALRAVGGNVQLEKDGVVEAYIGNGFFALRNNLATRSAVSGHQCLYSTADGLRAIGPASLDTLTSDPDAGFSGTVYETGLHAEVTAGADVTVITESLDTFFGQIAAATAKLGSNYHWAFDGVVKVIATNDYGASMVSSVENIEFQLADQVGGSETPTIRAETQTSKGNTGAWLQSTVTVAVGSNNLTITITGSSMQDYTNYRVILKGDFTANVIPS